ncbi:hypothetical protein SYNPS1DRAFT_31953 [Syncephalis pseudoplumigaleata]|uniref:Uncharacterized protein n=1 Tax=Syncephalis pseudoplumigaleata TaxID=1712513 RepID=A0A4P9YUB5_9FUNG|nr:hypothetical protein SYNPS1DRAFT_31953 [Syncephalis pseudoplumigaleata]|eukprot:RKP22450.1 hypothetical protein SYNPS1DRAFT_31953 [Syncephalis pseudoplumigaleata]
MSATPNRSANASLPASTIQPTVSTWSYLIASHAHAFIIATPADALLLPSPSASNEHQSMTIVIAMQPSPTDKRQASTMAAAARLATSHGVFHIDCTDPLAAAAAATIHDDRPPHFCSLVIAALPVVYPPAAMSSHLIGNHPDGRGDGGYTATDLYEPVMDLFSDTRTPGHDDVTTEWPHLLGHKQSASGRRARQQQHAHVADRTADRDEDQSSATMTSQHDGREAQQQHHYNLDVISGVREEVPEANAQLDSSTTSADVPQRRKDSMHALFDRIRHFFRR